MFRKIALAALGTATFLAAPANADTLYIPTIHVLQTDGDYMTYALAGMEGGVSRTECEMRAEAWEAEHADVIAVATQTLSERGEFGSIRVTCERK